MNNNQNSFNLLMSAIVGGIAGGLVVYFSDEKRREKIMGKFDQAIDEGKEKGLDLKEKIDKSIMNSRQNLAKKIRQVENRVAQS